MKIGLCWYKNGTDNKWTYDLIDHLTMDLETIIALASMTYIADLDTYELHLGNEKKSSTTLLTNARVVYYTYHRGSLLLNDIFVYLR